ncbi:MAG TPA: hypothetical protein VFD39_03640 [Trueperaceae bacterium]|nr:hypothetical protein [Trueperaceae bacterium]
MSAGADNGQRDGSGRKHDRAAADDAGERRYLVKTNAGDVVVVVNASAGGLDDDLFSLEPATEETLAGIDMTTPLSAFGAKVVDLIELHGTSDFTGSNTLREMLVKEKATFELRRIERFAKELAGE